ncbi:hypothetical protein [Phyllobacterium endophyticum]|uniref:Uncharacterized protein n=1 Tax=Phyllobacterium endophyticum TaxID=1149773 RepID=A0A2P7ARF7_9HYPH|nr:hypothetical protein [Phyllobacterium endophyticum]MBB3237407.1 hypothetical protein [Phyllobacterium endophyticum]PSH56743.1 hypothetical protein CU100_15475 [Phyllobacterium endophyticum]TYR44274.1 hypothetical protein FY050_03750 [Phyllobacterium endophyticum]
MDKGVAAAKRRFPARSAAIEERAAHDEEFRDLCIDFGDAEAELLRWQQSNDEKREERCAEYLELVVDLAKEIRAALGTAEIIPFHKRRPKAGI